MLETKPVCYGVYNICRNKMNFKKHKEEEGACEIIL